MRSDGAPVEVAVARAHGLGVEPCAELVERVR